MTGRTHLPNRREAERVSFVHDGHAFTATFSAFESGGLAEIFFVSGHAFLYANQFVAQTYQPLSLVLYELLVQLLIRQLVPPDLFKSTTRNNAIHVYPTTLYKSRYADATRTTTR